MRDTKEIDISIVITAYNYADYLEECIESCLCQDDSGLEYEVIVVDDGSTDQTHDILERISSPRLRKYRIENSGIEKASNFGFEKARGKYIVRVDADDKLFSNYLRDICPHLQNDIGFYYSDYSVINEDGKNMEEISLPEFQVDEIFKRGDFLATGTLYSEKTLTKMGGYSTVVKNSGLENYELILRTVMQGVRGMHIPNPLFCYRRHSLNISETNKEQIVRNGKLLFLRLGLGLYVTNEYHPYGLRLGVE